MSNRASFSFDEKNDEGINVGKKELPMTIAVLGNFSGIKSSNNSVESKYQIDDSVVINKKNIGIIFGQLDVGLSFEAVNYLSDMDNDFIVDLKFASMQDFQPKIYLKNIDFIDKYRCFIGKLSLLQGCMQANVKDCIDESELSFLQSLDIKANITLASTLSAGQLIRMLAFAQKRLNKQINTIIYSPELQQLEFNWISLKKMATFASDFEYCKLMLLNTTKNKLEDDLLGRSKLIESDLLYQIYTKELDQFGGEPVSLMLNAFPVEDDDIQLISALANVGQMINCPIICGINQEFFDLRDISILENDYDFSDYKKSANFSSYSKLAKKPSSRFIGFVASSVCMRKSYSNKDIDIDKFYYQDICPNNLTSGGLWGMSVFLFSYIFMQFFNKYGHCVGVDDSLNNVVEIDKLGINSSSILNWSPTREVQQELANFGVMTFRMLDRANNKIGLSELNMFNINSLDDYASVDLAMSERINVRLPQLLFVAQLQHYLRLIQRQFFARDDHKALKKELLEWLKEYISDSYMASDQIRTYRPLKSVDLKMNIQNKAANVRDRLQFSLSITPHSPYRGLEYSVSL